ncbi:MAG: YkvA family protein [Woeseiaceae bacterium]|nr:YkvA family protein [Woeseiaceae bacterium]
MGLRIAFELEESDLRHFRLIMNEARKAAARLSAEDIVASARERLVGVDTGRVPRFVAERLDNLAVMIRMLEDHEWRLPADDAARVLNALAYFRDTEDLIPDDIPGLGFLDDAIMIELVSRELRHEIDAYLDFCDYRERMGPRTSVKAKSTDITREDWLADRRKELQSRMHRRRTRNDDKSAGSPLRLRRNGLLAARQGQ